MSATNYTESKVLDHIFGKSAYDMPTNYIGIGLIPTETGIYYEPPEEYNYARVVMSSAYWSWAVGGQVTNILGIVFPQAQGGDWGIITNWYIFDSGTYGAGNLLLYGGLDPEWDVHENDIPQFNAGEIGITLS